jgi:dihydrolipoamide dehydrogenase
MDVPVPDIGDFKDVPVISVLVKAGDRVEVEQSIVTLESDKATVEVPSPAAGVVKEVKVKVGDKVSQGTVLLVLDEAAGEKAAVAKEGEKPAAEDKKPAEQAPEKKPAEAEKPAEKAPEKKSAEAKPAEKVPAEKLAESDAKPASKYDCDVLVLGSGPGGYSAAFRAADLGLKVMMVERYPALGGVCLNVGCIPSKALLHIAAVTDEARALAAHGISFGEPTFELEKLRAWKDKVVGKLSGGVAAMAKGRKVEVVTGVAAFEGPHEMKVGERKVSFDKCIIAAGSQAVKLPFFPTDPRVVDSTGALALQAIPKRMLIVGGGIIGLEMGTVYSTLGSRLDVVEMLDGLMPGADRDLVKVWQKRNEKRFDRIMLQTKTTKATAQVDGIRVEFDKGDAQTYDLVLVAVGRSPNGKRIAAEKAGVQVDERGFIKSDKQMRTNVPHIFSIGDVAGAPMLAHKATHEGHVAAEVAAGHKASFDARQIPSVAYTDPEIAWAGVTEDSLKGQKFGKSVFPWAASGRAIANGRDEGFVKLLFDEKTHRVIGGGIVGTSAGDLISEIGLAIEMGADADDIAHTIHPHPTLGESVGLAAEVFAGTCTDLPPPRKRP